MVKWDDGGGNFYVGDVLRTRERAEAKALAEYRTMVEAFLESREPLHGSAAQAAAASPAVDDGDAEEYAVEEEEADLSSGDDEVTAEVAAEEAAEASQVARRG